jgi:hypothetical protein
MEFTLLIYKQLLQQLILKYNSFIFFSDFIQLYQGEEHNSNYSTVPKRGTIIQSYAILRHDVDLLPHNSLRTAENRILIRN